MKRSLEERLALLSPEGMARPMRGESLGAFFREVGLLTHLAYPAQRLEQLKEELKVGDERSYVHILTHVVRNVVSENGEANVDSQRRMAQLFIEPLAAIHEMLKEDEDNDRV